MTSSWCSRCLAAVLGKISTDVSLSSLRSSCWVPRMTRMASSSVTLRRKTVTRASARTSLSKTKLMPLERASASKTWRNGASRNSSVTGFWKAAPSSPTADSSGRACATWLASSRAPGCWGDSARISRATASARSMRPSFSAARPVASCASWRRLRSTSAVSAVRRGCLASALASWLSSAEASSQRPAPRKASICRMRRAVACSRARTWAARSVGSFGSLTRASSSTRSAAGHWLVRPRSSAWRSAGLAQAASSTTLKRMRSCFMGWA